MSINTIIEEQKKEWDNKLNMSTEDGGFTDYISDADGIDYPVALNENMIWDWHKQSLIQILEAEVERLKGERYDDNSLEDSDNKEDIWYKKGYNQSLDDQITHLTNIIKEICLEKQ